jgi:PPM family protein phosphatase
VAYLTIQSAAQTRKGKAKRANDDAVLQDPRNGVFGIADGGPWTGTGAAPSRIFLNSVIDRAVELGNALDESVGMGEGAETPLHRAFQDLFDEATRAIRQSVGVQGAEEGPTTTGTIIAIREEAAAVGHVGNTRAYLLRGARAYRLTRDHSVAQRMADNGLLEAAAVAGHPERKTLYQALGQTGSLQVDVTRFELVTGDRLILLSDGVYDVVRGRELHRMGASTRSQESLVRSIMELAGGRGALDDLSCVVIAVDEVQPEADAETVPPHHLLERHLQHRAVETDPVMALKKKEQGEATEEPQDPEARLDRLAEQVNHFRNIALFEGMSEPQILHAIGMMQPRTLQPGHTLFREGEASDSLYIVTLGVVEVMRNGRILARIRRGEVVGEMALLDGDTRSATVRAVEISRVLQLARSTLDDLVLADPNFAIRLYHNLALTLARRLRAANQVL